MSNTHVDQRIQRIVTLAFERTPAMKERMEAANLQPSDIKSAQDLARLPVIKKDDMVRLQAENPPFGGMLAVEITDLKWVFFSPGPLYEGVMDDEGVISESASFLQDLGVTDKDILLNAMSYQFVPFGTRFDSAMRSLGGTVLPTGVGNTELQVKMMLDLGATIFVGTPTFLAALIAKVEEMGMEFQQVSRLRTAIVTAEPLPPSLREKLKSYGLRLFNLYGTAEAGLLGYECEQEMGFHIPENVLVQVCDLQSGALLPPGEVGEIVATNFNEAYPLIRFGTGDLSMLNSDPCPCGRSSQRLMGWMGRAGEAVKVRGMFLHPNQLTAVVSRFQELGAYQAVVSRPKEKDVLTLRVELRNQDIERQPLAQSIKGLIKEVCRVRADTIEFIEPGSLEKDAKLIVDDRTWQ